MTAASSDGYEYGVAHVSQKAGEEPHRTGMASRDEAIKWIREWNEMGGKPGVFTIVRRPLGGWLTA